MGDDCCGKDGTVGLKDGTVGLKDGTVGLKDGMVGLKHNCDCYRCCSGLLNTVEHSLILFEKHEAGAQPTSEVQA
jgi:hypothetical protein